MRLLCRDVTGMARRCATSALIDVANKKEANEGYLLLWKQFVDAQDNTQIADAVLQIHEQRHCLDLPVPTSHSSLGYVAESSRHSGQYDGGVSAAEMKMLLKSFSLAWTDLVISSMGFRLSITDTGSMMNRKQNLARIIDPLSLSRMQYGPFYRHRHVTDRLRWYMSFLTKTKNILPASHLCQHVLETNEVFELSSLETLESLPNSGLAVNHINGEQKRHSIGGPSPNQWFRDTVKAAKLGNRDDVLRLLTDNKHRLGQLVAERQIIPNCSATVQRVEPATSREDINLHSSAVATSLASIELIIDELSREIRKISKNSTH